MADVHNVSVRPPKDAAMAELFAKDLLTTGKGPEHVPFWKFGDPRYVAQNTYAHTRPREML